MTLKALGAATSAIALLALVGAAQAQTRGHAAAAAPAAAAPAAALAGPPLTFGAPIPGMCVFYEQRAVGASSAGKAAGTRLQQLAQVVQAELQPQQTSLENDVKAFRTQAGSLSADARQKQEAALQQRAETFERLRAQRAQELQATQSHALQRIQTAMQPIVRTVFQARTCSILINGDEGVFAANPAMDVTDQVIQQLNAALPTITFDREHIDPSQAAPR